MAKLNAARRNALPSSDFVFPGSRKFPIEDASHARDALSRASAKGGSVQSEVESKVHARFPGIGKKKGSLRSAASRSRGAKKPSSEPTRKPSGIADIFNR